MNNRDSIPGHSTLAAIDRMQEPRWLHRVLIAVHHSFVLAPYLLLLDLYLFSWRAMMFIGHWPEPLKDDPKFIAPGDALFDLLYCVVIPLLLWMFVGVIIFPILTMLLRRSYSWRWIALMIGLFVLGWLLFILEPTGRMEWFMD
ncbi:MAG TPA: hypothetical protein VFO07_05385 [Roseiflexaceae bacterium]|nr:hypothetical protein [Roseiflexaceae bacterium]